MVAVAQHSISINGRQSIPSALWVVMNIFSAGMCYVLCRLFFRLRVVLRTRACKLAVADHALVYDAHGHPSLHAVATLPARETLALKRYSHKGRAKILDTPYGRFIFDHLTGRFVPPPSVLPSTKGFQELYQHALLIGQAEEQRELHEKYVLYGPNVMGPEPPSVGEVLLRNVFCVQFMVELGSLMVWIFIGYYCYVFIIGSIYAYLFCRHLASDLRQRKNALAISAPGSVLLLRDGRFQRVCETEVYPGDIVRISATGTFPCDAEILKGDVVADESFLTGESVPICKGLGSVVYSGTQILKSACTEPLSVGDGPMKKLVRVKNLLKQHTQMDVAPEPARQLESIDALGVVIKTGRRSKRGVLLTNIALKKPVSNQFTKQSHLITWWLLIASLLLSVLAWAFLSRYLPLKRAFEYSLDVLLTFYSPSLGTALDLGIDFAKFELAKKGINTTEIERINTAGQVDTVVFDKTGTLTEIGVDILCFDTIDRALERFEDLDATAQLGFSTCHSVMELDGGYSGDVLDMKMFQFSGSTLAVEGGRRTVALRAGAHYEPLCREEDESDGEEEADGTVFFRMRSAACQSVNGATAEVERIYDFDSYLKRMSVVVRAADGQRFVFCKGAPDALARVLEAVPPGYHERVGAYGLQGHRVIALATRPLASSGGRGADEARLRFCGFVVFENRIKGETRGVVGALRAAGIAPRMCTGDSILTAISVARECGMVGRDVPVLFPVIEGGDDAQPDAEWYCVADEDYIFDRLRLSLHSEYDRATPVDFVVACEGREYEQLQGTAYQRFLLERGAVFARFTPENKKRLIEDYAGARLVTMYCGDGANDTGALAAADVGLSLATNEASLAASFNAVRLGAAVDLIKQGRSSLAMSIQQFNAMFCVQMLNGLQVATLLSVLNFPTDIMSLFNDLVGVFLFTYTLTRFSVASTISPTKIVVNLKRDVCWQMAELLTILGVLLGVLYIGATTVRKDVVVSKTAPVTVSFFIIMAVFLTKFVVFTNFGPYRQSRLKNPTFLAIFACLVLFAVSLFAALLFGYDLAMRWFEFTRLGGPEIVKLGVGALLACAISLLYGTRAF